MAGAIHSSELEDWRFYPDFFTPHEQSLLLRSALKKLDSLDPRVSRRRRRKSRELSADSESAFSSTYGAASFLNEEAYTFEEGHFDGVIKFYREAHVTSWPPNEAALVERVLGRLDSVLPSADIQTHILHLSSEGEILPHVDNVEASGSWILGISLGSSRILRMEPIEASEGLPFDALLNPGSVYIQKDRLRFNYKHSILRTGVFARQTVPPGQRLSIMIRDRLNPH